MCGRYYIDDDTAKEIEKLVRQAEAKLSKRSASVINRISSTDIHPSENAPILFAEDGGIACIWLRWGFPMQQDSKKGLVFNARCESAAEKPFFRDGIRHRRIVVPATSFYEWDSEKNKFTFQMQNRKVLFMAGCCKQYRDGEHFVILTTAANSSMQPIHDRMPLLLEETEIMDWILDNSKTETFLRKIPSQLIHNTDFEQMRFF